MSPLEILKKYGLSGTIRKVLGRLRAQVVDAYHLARTRGAIGFVSPTPQELLKIEGELAKAGVPIHDFSPSEVEFKRFQSERYFPPDYHGGIDGSVWEEKLLEHWIASGLLGLMAYAPEQIYVDVAAGGSPWAQVLRERYGISAYALDLSISDEFRDLEFYVESDATATDFADHSVDGVSLQCAYEMFMGDDDSNLIVELNRILKPGGKAIIVPLYLHTHYCAYSTPDRYGMGHADSIAKEYVCRDWRGIPSARFYDAEQLVSRVLSRIVKMGMTYRLLALRNQSALGRNIYCHFILEITK